MKAIEVLDGFIFDLDGTLYLGEKALPGAVETIAFLRNQGKQVLFVTNKPLQPRMAYAEKLTRLGIPAEPDDIITSGYVLGYHIAKHDPELNLYVIGELALLDELRGFGLNVMDEFTNQSPLGVIQPTGVDAIIVAFDRTLNYRKLNTAYQALMQGAGFFATNADKMCPMPDGGIPDAGGTIAALEHMSGRRLELLAGKPSQLILEVIFDRLGLRPERCLMIGDRLETDITMGQKAGMKTASVLTGVSTRADAERMKVNPDFILENIGHLPNVLKERHS